MNTKKNTTVSLLLSILLCEQLYAKGYDQGSFSIQPAMFGLANYSLGFRSPNSRINGLGINAYKAANGFGVSEVEKFSIGYSSQFSYFPCDNLSLDFRISYIEDKPLDADLVVFPLSFDSFHHRKNWVYSVGFHHFIERKDTKWLPSFGMMIGYLFQGNTEALLFDAAGNMLGDALLQPSQNRLKFSFDIGVDYQFTPRWAINLTSGVSYLERPAPSYETPFGYPVVFENNNLSFTIPVYVSIRNVIPKKKPSCGNNFVNPPEQSTQVDTNLLNPATESTTPAAEENKPAVEENKPAAEENKPAVEENKSAAEENNPAVEENKSAAEENESAEKSVNALKQNWTIQVGSFRSSKNADALVQQLKNSGYPAYSKQINQSEKTLSVVLIGPFQDKNEVIQTKKVIQTQYDLQPT